MSIFEYLNYREWLISWIAKQKNKGWGQCLAIAKHLNLSTTMISHILKGTNDLAVEQGLKLAEYCYLSVIEKEYLIELIHYARAKDLDTKSYYKKKIDDLIIAAGVMKNRLNTELELTKADQAEFYSDWIYAAVHLCAALPGLNNPEAISQFLGLDRKRVDTVIQFLLAKQFLRVDGEQLKLGLRSTMISSDAVFQKNHHRAWRLKSVMDLSMKERPENLNYSSVVCLNEADFLKIREILIASLKEFQAIYAPSPSEKIAYLNLDWVQLGHSNTTFS